MAAGVELPESERVGGGGGGGVRLEIPARDDDATPQSSPPSSSPPQRMPKRLRQRLLESKNPSPPTVGEIEAKLRDADLRRQKFYDELSSRARPKPRSPSRSSSHEEDLALRLAAKLQAAEQKRLSILAEAQTRLARLDKLRRAAKTGAEMRLEKKRQKLGSEVEVRFHQAEVNRMLILSTYGQRRATVKERRSQSLLRRMAWENKYKERVCAAIHQKRAAAERNRLRLLEAEKKRARARVLQVRRVAKSVLHQREVERRRMEHQLEDRLQRARRQRAEYLRQRGGLHSSVHVNWNRLHKQADMLSRKIARCWKRFCKLRKTTFSLTKTYDALKINEKSVKLMPFEQLALLIESNATLQTVKPLLERFESRFKLSHVAATPSSSTWQNIDHLLKRVASPNRKSTPRNSSRSRITKVQACQREAVKAKLSRYQVRVVLCAYMILSHPDAVFSGQGEREISLAKSAEDFVREFELLLKIILDGPVHGADERKENAACPRLHTLRSQLLEFDRAWCSYLNCFVVWKVKDAKSLEEDLVRAACQLELSMIQTCKMTAEGDSGALTHDMKAIQSQVSADQKLLREKVQHLSGEAGLERMEYALSDTRTKYFQAKEAGTTLGSPIKGFLPPSSRGSGAGESPDFVSFGSNHAGSDRPSKVVRSLFPDDASPSGKEKLPDPRSSLDGKFAFSGQDIVLENESIVNEVVHNRHLSLADSIGIEDQAKAKIRETMEKAFWDGIIESMEQEKPHYDRVAELVMEVRDEFCEIAPKSWKEEITAVIDLEILSQVLKSGDVDMNHLGKILHFALVTLQKLSAPANDDEMKATHQKLLNELAEICESKNKSKYAHVIALVKGLRFVLEQIQALKQEMSKARIRIMEPLLKSPAGLDYLQSAFANHYGSPSRASRSLPATVLWLSSVLDGKDQEWSEHTNYLSALTFQGSSQILLPTTTLRTGIHLPVKSGGSLASSPTPSDSSTAGCEQLECSGEQIDTLVRLGLLKLVSRVSGITQETIPETLKLNFLRLRGIQAQIQKIIVISTSALICWQILLSEKISSSVDMETVMSKCVIQLLECLDSTDDVGITEIVEIISRLSENGGELRDDKNLNERKEFMARMLAKSLQDGDAVFGSVSRAVYLAMRGVVLGGNGPQGRALAEMALRKVGAGILTANVVEAAGVLLVVASVSVCVHGPWYAQLLDIL